MAIRYVLFDLDGTLLPMDTKSFFNSYMKCLTAHMVPHGYEPKDFVGCVHRGLAAMLRNDGSRTNEERFWEVFRAAYGEERAQSAHPILEAFYQTSFEDLRAECGFTPRARETVRLVRELGFGVALATSPLYPAVATRSRIQWAGLSEADFDLITTFENSCYAKPLQAYYRAVAEALGVAPEECLMVGNDISDDMPAAKAGMRVFLLTDHLIAKEGEDPAEYPCGSFDELQAHIRALRS